MIQILSVIDVGKLRVTRKKFPGRPVHTKDENYSDNDQDIVVKIVLNIQPQL